MPGAGDYGHYRRMFQDISGGLTLAAADGDTTLVTVRSSKYTIFIQRLFVHVETDAAQSASFEDSAGTPKQIGFIPASPGVGPHVFGPYGATGIALTAGANFR